jgi:hypothetical protein
MEVDERREAREETDLHGSCKVKEHEWANKD